MLKKFLSWKIFVILISALIIGFYDLPPKTQENLLPFIPKDGEVTENGEVVQKTKMKLGLDLQGGSQLDYKINLNEVPDADKPSIIEGVREVIERRVNGLGVSEPNIYISEIAGETHIIVELANTTDISQEDINMYLGESKTVEELTDDEKKYVSLEKAKATVGKTIQLEFKEQKDELDPAEKDKVREEALVSLNKIKEGKDFSIIAQEEELAKPGKVQYEKSDFVFESELPTSVRDTVAKLEVGQYHPELVETGGSFFIDTASGQTIEQTALAIVKLVDKKEEVKDEKAVEVSHILIAYEGSDAANADTVRTEDEAYELAKELKVKLSEGEDFTTLAKEYSDDTSNKEQGGTLSKAVNGDGTYVYDFEQAALELSEGAVSDPVKTQFGYHLIKADTVTENATETKYKYEAIKYSTVADPWINTGLTGIHFVHADVQLDNFYQPYVSIQFNEEGAKLFEEITERNVGKPLAIFVGGELISAPNVNQKIAGGNAQITGQFTQEESESLARDLNTGAIPAPIVLTGEYTIGATLGQSALQNSLLAGTIGLALVMLFMALYYRVSGLIADLALLIYSAILIFMLKSQLSLGLALIIALIVFAYLVVKVINNKDSGWEKFMSFILSCFAFFFITFLLKTGVVLTLAGIAGIVLSIGMAVDANILIFERLKEELKDGKPFNAAVETAFDRAWTAIRDSNFSTLLTCAILFYFGSSIIKGFAFNLAAGILVSMFTAIVITKTLLQGFVGTKLSQNLSLFGLTSSKKERKPIRFTKMAKIWLPFSGILVGISIITMFVLGLNLGIDFKGGTLMEFQFEENVTKEQLTTTLREIEEDIKSGNYTVVAPEESAEPITEEDTEEEPTNTSPLITESKLDQSALEPETNELDLSGMQVIPSGENNFVIKTKYLSSEDHDLIVELMKEKLPNFTEPRFTTIGPTLGKSLLEKAVIAIVIALVMIVIYIGFAFRKIPKEVSPWRFGICAIIALAHDIIIVTGIFIVLGHFLNVEIDALFITAMLTVFGYSVNDTIIIFDRIRENLIRHQGGDLEEITDVSLSQTLARSINTSLSTLIALIAVLLWGSASIFYFVLALTIGIAIGTYSSLFTAGPILVYWTKWALNKPARKR